MKPVSISDLQLCFFFMRTLSFKTVSYVMICENLRQLKYIRAFKCTFKVIIPWYCFVVVTAGEFFQRPNTGSLHFPSGYWNHHHLPPWEIFLTNVEWSFFWGSWKINSVQKCKVVNNVHADLFFCHCRQRFIGQLHSTINLILIAVWAPDLVINHHKLHVLFLDLIPKTTGGTVLAPLGC